MKTKTYIHNIIINKIIYLKNCKTSVGKQVQISATNRKYFTHYIWAIPELSNKNISSKNDLTTN